MWKGARVVVGGLGAALAAVGPPEMLSYARAVAPTSRLRRASRALLLASALAAPLLARPDRAVAAPLSGAGDDEVRSSADSTRAGQVGRYESEVAALRSRLTRLRQYIAEFPRSLTEVEALAASFSSPRETFEHVRDHIALEPYPGILKGPAGTWITRGGNALDRALLLAALLREQGIAATIAHGKLSEAQARGLLQQISSAPGAVDHIAASIPWLRKESPPSAEQVAIRRLLDEGAAARKRAIAEDLGTGLRRIQASLDAAGVGPAGDVTPQQLAALRDHYWVQATIEDETVDLDPSFAAAAPGKRFTEAVDTLDPDAAAEPLFQRVRLRVIAVHLDGGQTLETETLAHEFRAVDLWDKNLRFALMPKEARPGVNEFRATLVVGEDTYQGEPFQLRAAPGQEGDGPGGAPVAGPVLGRVYLEALTSGPQLREARSRRVILDRLESQGGKPRLLAALRDDRAIRPLLVQIWDGAIAVGALHPVHVIRTWVASLEALEPFEEKARARAYLGRSFDASDVPAPALSPDLLSFFFVSSLATHQAQRQVASHARLYHERPRLAFLVHGFAVSDWGAPGSGSRARQGLDLLNAPFQVVGPRDEADRLARQAGVADTVLERHGLSGERVFNTLPLFAAATQQGIPIVTVLPNKPAALEALALPAAIKEVLREELARGRIAILPSRLVPLAQTRTFGWWSVDPATGYAVGRMELGGAQGLVEATRMNELVTEWTQIYVKFFGGVLRCYMEALKDALGSAELEGLKVKVTVRHGEPGESPMPSIDQLTACVIDKACDAVKDLAASYFAGGTAFPEAKLFHELIGRFLEKKAVGWAVGKTGEGCKAALERVTR